MDAFRKAADNFAAYGHALLLLVRRETNKGLAYYNNQTNWRRWRMWVIGSYALAAAATALAALPARNFIHAHILLYEIAEPHSLQVFVRNDAQAAWHNIKITLDGRYQYELPKLDATEHLQLTLDRFARTDGNGLSTRPPLNMRPQRLKVSCDEGAYEETRPQVQQMN